MRLRLRSEESPGRIGTAHLLGRRDRHFGSGCIPAGPDAARPGKSAGGERHVVLPSSERERHECSLRVVVQSVPRHLGPDDLLGEHFDPAVVDDGSAKRKPDPRKIASPMHSIGVPLDDYGQLGPVSKGGCGEAVRGKVPEGEGHSVYQQLGASVGIQHVVIVALNRTERHIGADMNPKSSDDPEHAPADQGGERDGPEHETGERGSRDAPSCHSGHSVSD
jgi:hypothetical protein